MTKQERILAAIEGIRPDKWPFSFWTHLPGVDLDPDALADATYDFYRAYDIDFIKTMNNGMYPVEDFGCKVDYSDIPNGGIARIIETPVNITKDWYSIESCSVFNGSLARELNSLHSLINKTKGDSVPVLFTVFSPLTTANKLSKNRVKKDIAAGHDREIRYALDVITETTCNLVKEAISLGAAGIFFAAQHCSYDYMSIDQYCAYGAPYDLKVLQSAEDGWMNVLHAHGNNIIFELLKDYPVHVFNWHAWETLPAVNEARDLSDKCLLGGLNRTDITRKKRNELLHQIYECYRLTGGEKHILSPGCVIRHPLDLDTLNFVKEAKEFVESKMGESNKYY